VARSAVALGADDARPAPSGLDLDSTPTWRKFLDKLTGGFETRLPPPLEENHRAEPAATTSTAAASVVAEDPSPPPVAPELDTNVRAQVPVSAPRSGLDPLVSDDAYDKQRLLLEGLKLPPNGELAPQWRKFLDKPATLDEGKAGIVREYLRREFPMSMLYEFHEFQRNAQVFELQDNHGKVIQLATITAEFLDHHTESELRAWIETHKLAHISVSDLIAYRQAREKLVERVATFPVKSDIGELTGYAFVTPFDPVHHMAFVYGKIGDGKNVLTRLHRADIVADVFGGAKVIPRALARFKAEGRGVLVLLRDGTAGVPVMPPGGEAKSSEAARDRQWREIGLGAQILRDLGISSIRILTSRTLTYVGLAGFEIEIVGTEPIEG